MQNTQTKKWDVQQSGYALIQWFSTFLVPGPDFLQWQNQVDLLLFTLACKVQERSFLRSSWQLSGFLNIRRELRQLVANGSLANCRSSAFSKAVFSSLILEEPQGLRQLATRSFHHPCFHSWLCWTHQKLGLNSPMGVLTQSEKCCSELELESQMTFQRSGTHSRIISFLPASCGVTLHIQWNQWPDTGWVNHIGTDLRAKSGSTGFLMPDLGYLFFSPYAETIRHLKMGLERNGRAWPQGLQVCIRMHIQGMLGWPRSDLKKIKIRIGEGGQPGYEGSLGSRDVLEMEAILGI